MLFSSVVLFTSKHNQNTRKLFILREHVKLVSKKKSNIIERKTNLISFAIQRKAGVRNKFHFFLIVVHSFFWRVHQDRLEGIKR